MRANQRSRLIAATIELVAERGYASATVRDIARLAGVSKASFYEHFSGKEECFLATYDTALRGAASAVLRGERADGHGRERLRAGLFALAELIAAEPNGTKLVLVDGLASSPVIRDHVSRRCGLLEALVRERLVQALGGGEFPRSLIAALVRGLEHHARCCVQAGRPERFRDLVDPLLDWGLGFYCEEAIATFAATPIRAPAPAAIARAEPTGALASQGARGALVSATLRLASQEGYTALTPTRIRRAAGVSRASFDANFEDATSCFLAAVETGLVEIFAAASQAARVEDDWGRRTCLMLDRFAVSLVGAPDLARLAFVEIFDAAPASLRWHERIVAAWAEALYRGAPADIRPSPAVAEATVAAIWGLLADLVATDRPHLLRAQGARISFVALTPAMGAEGAAEAVEATWDARTAVR